MKNKFRLLVTLVAMVVLSMMVYAHGESEESEFTDSITIVIDGEDYTLGDMTDGTQGLPGHEWLKISDTEYFALHHNIGPNEAESWWASETENDELLYVANIVIDIWTTEKAEDYAERGYIYYHPLVHMEDGTYHTELVAWFQHIAIESFNLDGGPQPLLGHEVTPSIDMLFLPNWSTPYKN